MLAGPIYAQRRYHEYFYGVAPQFATATRPAYQAPGGYAGTQLLVAVSKRYANYWVGAYVRHDWLQARQFHRQPAGAATELLGRWSRFRVDDQGLFAMVDSDD